MHRSNLGWERWSGRDTGQEGVSSRAAGTEASGGTVKALLMEDTQEPPCKGLVVNAGALLVAQLELFMGSCQDCTLGYRMYK